MISFYLSLLSVIGLAKAYNASLSGTSSQATQSVLRDSYSEEQKRQGGLNTLGC